MAEKLRFYSSSADNLDAKAVETDSSVATPANVKSNYLFKDANTRELLSGTMPINSPETIIIDLQNTEGISQYIIPKGFHTGDGKVITRDLEYYTPGNASEEDVVKNKIFWVNGEKKIGSLDVEMAKQTATATASDLLEGKTAWVNKVKLTGTIPRLAKMDKILKNGESYTIPYGLSAGTTIISAESLENVTEGTAEAKDIINGKVAWVNGEKIIGSFDVSDAMIEELKDTNATKAQVLDGQNFYSAKYGQAVAGTMPNHTGQSTITIPIGKYYAIPEGYYDGVTRITTQTLADATQASAIAENILVAKTAWVKGLKITGTMPFIDATEQTLEYGTTYTIPKGYHTGNGKLNVAPLSETTEATATAPEIRMYRTAWVNGEKIVGSMPDNSDLDKELVPGETFYVPVGYHTGTGSVWVKSLDKFTEADAIASDLRTGKTAWVNGEKITGTMVEVESEEIVLDAGAKYTIPVGYHDGTGTVEAETLTAQTKATAIAENIIKDKTAWVNGEKITGTLEFTGTASVTDVVAGATFYNVDASKKLTGTLALTGNAKEEDVLEGVSFYADNIKRKLTGSLKLSGNADTANVLEGSTFYTTDPKIIITGTMPNNGAVSVQLLADETYTVPAGYHNGSGIVRAPSVQVLTEGTAEAADIIKDKTAWVNGDKLTGLLSLDGTATSDKVISGYTFYSTNPKQKITGSLTTVEAVTVTINAGETFNIIAGVHSGNGKVVGASLASQTVATAAAEDIYPGKTAWINGVKVTGSMTNNGTYSQIVNAGESINIPKGYHNGTGVITGASLESQTGADAVAANLLVDKTAWVNGEKITGTMVDNAAMTYTLIAGESVAIPEGYHNGSGRITAKTLDLQTVGDATAADILINKIAWVNGQKITGTMPQQTINTVRISAGNELTLPAGYYPDGIKIYSLHTDRLDLTGTNAWYEAADNSLHPEDAGYVDGSVLVVYGSSITTEDESAETTT